MKQDAVVTTEVQTPEPAAQAIPLAPPREVVPLTRVLMAIIRDSRREPQNYLDEVHVPHGGE